jgi:hypothetical protein
MGSKVDLPDYRNTTRGERWLRAMIEASEAADAGRRDAFVRIREEIEGPLLGRPEREPGEDDD